jgi:DNA polymerase-3 subunit gamma/tau
MLRQAWPGVVEAIKAKGRVAAIVIGNASVASFDEGVLTLRFPRQGDVKGFQGSKYEDLLKQAINAMLGVNVVIRAITGGGDAPSPARRPGPAPAAPAAPAPPDYPRPSGSAGTPGSTPPPTGPSQPQGPGSAAGLAGPPAGQAGNGGGAATHSFGSPGASAGDLPPLPPPPSPDDEDFDPDDEDMSSSTTVNELTGMALVQRELGAQIIAEYED